MQLLLSIFAVLLSLYILFKALQKNKNKKQNLVNEEFDEEVIIRKVENKNHEMDPLLQDYNNEPLLTEKPSAIPLPEDAAQSFQQENKMKPQPQEYIAFSIVPKQQDSIPGRLILSSLKGNGFSLGKQKLFHQYGDDSLEKPILFSVASLLEPGIFNEEEMVQNNYPGILLFMVLSKSFEPLEAFDKMLKNLRIIAVQLNGEILDSNDNLLTAQLINEYRNTIKDYLNREDTVQKIASQ